MNNKLLTLPLAMLAMACSQSEEKKPNIIFILADDMGYGDVAALNEDCKLLTPQLDRMVERGVTFTDAHTSSSVSTPTRYGVVTGRYNWRSTLKQYVYNGYSKALIPTSRETVASALKKGGYTTGCVGKWHMGWDWHVTQEGTNHGITNEVNPEVVDFSQPITNGPCDLGFDYFYGFCASLDMPPYVYVENNMATTQNFHTTVHKHRYGWWREGVTGEDFVHEQTLPHCTDKAIEFIQREGKGDNPFFLYLPYPAPHTPILPTGEWDGISGTNPYGDFVMMVDNEVGRLMAALEEMGIDDNTIVVFTADNGCSPAAKLEELHEKGHYPNYVYRGHKADLFEGGHHVPCIVQWPNGFAPGKSSQTVC
ncbi:MAG: arylsulfatase, partial [Rikenellaceae bacterium]